MNASRLPARHTAHVKLSRADGERVEVYAEYRPDADTGIGFSVRLAEGLNFDISGRVANALISSGYGWDRGEMSVIVSGDTFRYDPVADLAVTVAVLAAAGQVPAHTLTGLVFIGGVDHDGYLEPADGILDTVRAAYADGIREAVVPGVSTPQAYQARGIVIYGVNTLRELVAFLNKEEPRRP